MVSDVVRHDTAKVGGKWINLWSKLVIGGDEAGPYRAKRTC